MTRSCVGGGRDQVGQVLGIVREVGVHLADEIGASPSREGVLQAVDIGAAEAARAGAMHHLDAAWVILRELVGDRAGAVGRAVVDHQQPRSRRASSTPAASSGRFSRSL